jgi:hypothetical protein
MLAPDCRGEGVESTAGNDQSDRGSGEVNKGKPSSWRLIERVFAVIGALAALIAVVGVVIVGVEHLPISKLHHEEGMVSSLIPGDDYLKLLSLIGNEPDFHQSLHSGRQLYVFDRPWEWIQLIVDESGTVLSVGIYAKTDEFKATLVTGTIVNGPPIGQQLGQQPPAGAVGACGASWGFYFQDYQLPDADDSRSVIVGNLPVTDYSTSPNGGTPMLCPAFFSSTPCIIAYQNNYAEQMSLSSKLVSCILSMKNGSSMLEDIPTSIVIVTAPGQPVLPDMLSTVYFHTLAKVA